MNHNTRNVVFPDAGESVRTPDWLRPQEEVVRSVDFSRDYHNQPNPTSNAPSTPPPPPVDPLADEKEALAAERAELEATREALEAERANVAAQMAALQEGCTTLARQLEAIENHSIENLAEIAVSVCRVLVEDAFEELPSRAEALAKAALAHAQAASHGPATTQQGEGTLRVGAALHVALMESEEDLPASLDPALPPYGCVAETPSARVLAGLEERLGEVLSALKEAT